jgi:putative transposase
VVWEWKGKGREMRRAEPGSSQKLESRIPGNSYVRFGGERSEKGWPRYRQKFLLAGQSNKQYLAGPLPYFLHVPDLFFRPLFAFFIIELKSRKVIHVNVTRSPTDAWVAQQLREATPNGHTPTYLIRDNDRKFGPNFARVAASSGIKVLRTPYRTPQANAICEGFLGSVRRECLDRFLILHEKQLHRLLKGYVLYFNQTRPHQGLGQRIPDSPMLAASPPNQLYQVIAVPVLGGLHHDYQRAA